MEQDLPDIPPGVDTPEPDDFSTLPDILINEADADFNLSGVNHLPEEDDLIGALSGRMSQNSLRSEENYSGALFSTQTVSGTPPQDKKIESQTSFVGFISPRRNSSLPLVVWPHLLKMKLQAFQYLSCH